MTHFGSCRAQNLRLSLLLCLGLFTGCQPTSDSQESKRVLIFAAASTTDALEEVCAQFRESHPDADAAVSFAASSTLAQQIDQGAEADLFLSANPKWADFVAEKQPVFLRTNLLGNSLVLIQPHDVSFVVSSPQDLLDARIQKVAIADPESVPAGIYAREALTKLMLWESVRAKVVAGSDVRQTLAYVANGAADAGIVYSTDAVVSPNVNVRLAFEAGLTEPIIYPLVLLKRGSSRPLVQEFYEFLQSSAAREVFTRHGFTTVMEN